MFWCFPNSTFPIFKPTTFPDDLRYVSANQDLVLTVSKHYSILKTLLLLYHENDEGCSRISITQGAPTRRSVALHLLANVFGVSDSRFPIFKPTTFPGDLRYASAKLDWVLTVTSYDSALIDNFDGKIFVIFMLLKQLVLLHRQNVVFIDSQAAIKIVSCYNLVSSKLEFEGKQFINSFLSTEREVILQWTPSHCGINGNEQADKLAREASTLHPPCLLMRLRNSKRLLRDKFRQKKFPLLQNWLLANLGLVSSRAKDVLSFLPYLGWRV
ncbi:hypothetical protein TNCV_3017221 [Trichonephila clavipes]|nr:hypothetical protein TNCV_3017221 [Trichonephila clavipes]